jgi:hypothetical protein
MKISGNERDLYFYLKAEFAKPFCFARLRQASACAKAFYNASLKYLPHRNLNGY